jgi:catechol 2,3-dioxygenase-like lactoylglutathione lyase family enzyme
LKTPASFHISVMVAVPDAPAAVDWYKRALGADVLWDFGSVVGLGCVFEIKSVDVSDIR